MLPAQVQPLAPRKPILGGQESVRRKSVLFKDQHFKKIEGSHRQSSILGSSGTPLKGGAGDKDQEHYLLGTVLNIQGVCLLFSSSLAPTPLLTSTSWVTTSWSSLDRYSTFLQVKCYSNLHAIVLVDARNLRIRRVLHSLM